jgi:phosphoribosylamine--glycine ligase
VFHAGTARDSSGQLVANGGRVLGITAVGDTIADAQAKAYQGVDAVQWTDAYCRRDIGWRAIATNR